jgi:predicted Rossmann fold nucleotide-binding protein DprA/Smf involved in DNA uptake
MEMTETMPSLTQDTQAILLLCARLGQRDGGYAKPLTTHQYSTLARWLHEQSLRPRDLLRDVGRNRLNALDLKDVTREVVESLLERGTALAVLIERWTSHGLWVISRGDPEYPNRYKSYLQHAAPPILFGIGEVSILQCGGLAVVGSRHASDEELDFARRVGIKCASQQIPVISGAAKGIDSESMQTTMDQRGRAVGVLAEGLGRASVAPRYHDAILDGHLTLISPYEPDSRWFAHTAMDRNKLVYGLADAALIVSSGDEQGGTWAGAIEALKHKRVPVYVRTSEDSPPGNRKLIQAGARAFSEESMEDISLRFQQSPVSAPLFEQPSQEIIPANGAVRNGGAIPSSHLQVEQAPQTPMSSDAVVTENKPIQIDPYEYVAKLIPVLLSEPKDERVFAKSLNVVPTQAKAWLKRAVDEGIVRRLTKPIRYVADCAGASFFAGQKHP